MFVRRNAWTLKPDDPVFEYYAIAVDQMQKLDPTDRRSWTYQAAMHGSYSTPPLALWDTCEHGTWYFTAWHRMYVYYFESIVRSFVVAAGGPKDWALPYWNYTPSDGGNPSMPEAFRREGSPLYVWQRRIKPYNINNGDPLPNPITAIAATMNTIPWTAPAGQPSTAGFFGQQTAPIHLNGGFGALEQQPHNVVHDALGGTYGWMADVQFAAQDPIFWLHHTNIDRLWARWISLGGGRINPPPANWQGQPFSFFDAAGNQVSMPCHAVLDTTSLGYEYDSLGTPAPVHGEPVTAEPPATGRAEIVGASTGPVTLTGRRAAGHVAVNARARNDVLRAAGTEQPRKVFLSLDDIEAVKNPGTVYGVYVNLPSDATDETAEQHLAGALSFFGIEGSGRRADGSDHVHSYSAGYDITALVGELSGRGQWDDTDISVTFHPIGVPMSEDPAEENLPTVTVGRISVHYV